MTSFTPRQRSRDINVQALRKSLGQTKAQFAAEFGFSTRLVLEWERGDSRPRGHQLVLLLCIAHSVVTVREALYEHKTGELGQRVQALLGEPRSC